MKPRPLIVTRKPASPPKARKPVAKTCPCCTGDLRRRWRRIEITRWFKPRNGTRYDSVEWRELRVCLKCKIVVLLCRLPNANKIRS